MSIKVLYFGQLQDITQLSEEDWEAEHTSQLQKKLVEKYPALAKKTFAISLNKKIVKEASLKEGDTLALLPPFSGG